MQISVYRHPPRNKKGCLKTLLVTKFSTFFLLAACLQLSAAGFSQTVTLSLKKAPLKQVFLEIKKQTGYSFLWDEDMLKNKSVMELKVKNASIEEVMDKCLQGQPLTYSIGNNMVVVKRKKLTSSIPLTASQPVIKVRGTVLAEDNQPLPGVSVSIKGTSRGTVTDATGFFEIGAKEGDVLVFSFIGYSTIEYVVGKKQGNITISLKQKLGALDQVVVTGYSEQKVKNLASSISVVSQSNIDNKPITQLSQALQGGVTGISVAQGSGLPGGDAATVKIRGINTLGYTDPLVLVDGVPFDLNSIDPVTVQSITILKDAAAASIYGARAANGVILVTTKRGTAGKVQITYDAYAGIQKTTYLPQFADAAAYMQTVNDADVNVGQDKTYSDSAILLTRQGSDPLHYPNTDWTKNVITNPNPLLMNHTIGITGGNSLARFAITASYLTQDGIMMNTNYNRFMLRANTSVTLRQNLSMYLDLNVVRGNQEQPYADGRGNAAWILSMAYGIPPNIVAKYPLRDDGLQSYGNFGEMRNPVANLEAGGIQHARTDNIMVNFQPKWEIIPDLNLKLQYDFQITATNTTVQRDAYNFIDYFTNNLVYTFSPRYTTAQARSTYNYLSVTLDYTKNIGKHRIFLLGGVSEEYNTPNDVNISTLQSGFGKLYYSYDDRFLLELADRADGSSKFGPGHKWGTFPSVAMGWNISNESFMKPVKALSNWKLRASYGLLGNNQNVGSYAYQSTISASNGVENSFGNPVITWERVKELDLGTDIGFFNNDISIKVDWYNKKTDDILLAPPIAMASGLGSIAINAGDVRNVGWEYELDLKHDFGNHLNLFMKSGFSIYKNTILKLPGGPYYPGNTIDQIGQPIGVYYGYKTAGLLQQGDVGNVQMFSGQQAGDIRYIDLNRDGVLDDSDKTIIGNPNPRLNYFIDLGGSYKGFDVEVLLSGYGNNTIAYSGRLAAPLDIADPGAKPMTWQMDYWRPNNTNARYPRVVPNGLSSANVTQFSDFWLANAAYARVKFIQLGYSLPSKLIQKFSISSFRIYVNAQNPFTFTKLPFLDPEAKGNESTYPLMRVFTAGLNVRF